MTYSDIPDCPICGKPPVQWIDGATYEIECCGLKVRSRVLAKARGRWRAVVEGYRRSCEAWDRAMGKPTDDDIEKSEMMRLMGNGAVAEKKLNAFHDGRLMR